MKKTLVALAVLAASGASFAQVSLSGEFAYGYSASTTGVSAAAAKAAKDAGKAAPEAATSSGGGLDTAQLVFSAKEDLGGGTSVAVTMKTDGTGGRTGSLNNDDQTIELKTRFASFKAGSWKPGNWLAGATGYAPWYGLDGKVLSGRSARDSMGLSVPIGPVTLSVTAYEPANLIGEDTGNAGTSEQQNTTFNAAYGTGGLSLSAGYVMFSNQNVTDPDTFKTVTSDTKSKSILRFGGKYDFGLAQIGAGMSIQSLGGGGTRTENLISVSAPLGALSLSAGYAINKLDVTADTKNSAGTVITKGSALQAGNGSRTGFMLGAQYNMSKRTYVIGNYGSWLGAAADSAGAAPNVDNSNVMALTLVHDF